MGKAEVSKSQKVEVCNGGDKVKNISWGMIGCGAVTEKKSGPGLYKAHGSKLEGVFSRSIAKAEDYAKRHHIPKVYQCIEELLEDSHIDAVYIATPPKFHKEYALACMKHGKIPYIEKPLAMNMKECQEILACSQEVGIPVFVAYYRRGMEKFKKIKSLLEEQSIGEVRAVYVRHLMQPLSTDLNPKTLHWTVKVEETQGGRFIDMGTHILDMLEFLLGEIIEVSGNATNRGGLYKVEDTVVAQFKFKSGILGSGIWCYVAKENLDEMCIVGSKGSIRFSVMDYSAVKLKIGDQEISFEFEEPEHVSQPYIQSIVDELNLGVKSNADLESSVNNIRIIDEILKEYRKIQIKDRG